MKAIYLVRHAAASRSFEFREEAIPVPRHSDVVIKTICSGLNFADIMVRKNLYDGAPKLPAVIGFDACGTITAVGAEVKNFKPGDVVVALCKFSGYAEYICTPASGVAKIPEHIDPHDAVALAVQYLTAYYAAAKLTQLQEGDKVLIHAGAGGLGRALIQYALFKKCIVFATAGSEEKITMLKNMGVHHPINYYTSDFAKDVARLTNQKGLDVVFDGIGGSNARKSFKSLATGGRLVLHGASVLSSGNLFSKIFQFLSFGLYHPVMLMMPSKSILGINMLEMADHKPEFISQMLSEVIQLTVSGIFKPETPHRFPAADIAEAHAFLENRKSSGKVCIVW
ncbi:MAG: zinc-binding dehydrogenase [Saprospiraceae bacterium]|nr:zinc-binding dehydrogenase [Saprospiraceae bacterium]